MKLTLKAVRGREKSYRTWNNENYPNAYREIVRAISESVKQGSTVFVYGGNEYLGFESAKSGYSMELYRAIDNYIEKPRTKKSGWSNTRKRKY